MYRYGTKSLRPFLPESHSGLPPRTFQTTSRVYGWCPVCLSFNQDRGTRGPSSVICLSSFRHQKHVPSPVILILTDLSDSLLHIKTSSVSVKRVVFSLSSCKMGLSYNSCYRTYILYRTKPLKSTKT